MHETQITLTGSDDELLHSLARQTGKDEGEVVREALTLLKDQLAGKVSDRRASLRRAAGIWKDRDDLPALDVLREEMNRTAAPPRE